MFLNDFLCRAQICILLWFTRPDMVNHQVVDNPSYYLSNAHHQQGVWWSCRFSRTIIKFVVSKVRYFVWKRKTVSSRQGQNVSKVIADFSLSCAVSP